MDYSDPPRRLRPSRYPGLAPNEERHPPTGRAPWEDEPFPANSGSYRDPFDGGSTDAFNDGFTDAFNGASSQPPRASGFRRPTSADPYGQPPSTGEFGRPPATGTFQLPPATGEFGQPPSTGSFRQPPATGEFSQPPSTGSFRQTGSADDFRASLAVRPKQRLSAAQLIAGAVAGFLAAAAAIGVANLTAAFVRPQASPIIAVGGAFIDRTPPALKNFAVEKFGENDKTMLLLGMYVTIALIAIVMGMLAYRRIYIGVAGIGLFGLFGAFVAFTRPESHLTDVIPSIVGGIAGMVAIVWLIGAATRRTESGSSPTYPTQDYPTQDYQKGWAA